MYHRIAADLHLLSVCSCIKTHVLNYSPLLREEYVHHGKCSCRLATRLHCRRRVQVPFCALRCAIPQHAHLCHQFEVRCIHGGMYVQCLRCSSPFFPRTLHRICCSSCVLNLVFDQIVLAPSRHLPHPLHLSHGTACPKAGTYNGGKDAFQCPEWKANTAKCNSSSVNTFGNYITAQMKEIMTPPNSVYLDSCYRHCGQVCIMYHHLRDFASERTRERESARSHWSVCVSGGAVPSPFRIPCVHFDEGLVNTVCMTWNMSFKATNQLSGFGAGKLTPLTAFKLWYEGGAAALPNNGFIDQNQAFPCPACCFTPKIN